MFPILESNGFERILLYGLKSGYFRDAYEFMFGRFRNNLFEYVEITIVERRVTVEVFLNAVKLPEYINSVKDINIKPVQPVGMANKCEFQELYNLGKKKTGKLKFSVPSEIKLGAYMTVWGRRRSYRIFERQVKECSEAIEELFKIWHNIYIPHQLNEWWVEETDYSSMPYHQIGELCKF